MQELKRVYKDFNDLGFTIDLSSAGKTKVDIIDIVFSVKLKTTDADDSVLIKKLSLNEISITGNDTDKFVTGAIEWGENDYNNFTIDKTYLAGIFPKFTGDPSFTENIDSLFEIVIIKDFLRE